MLEAGVRRRRARGLVSRRLPEVAVETFEMIITIRANRGGCACGRGCGRTYADPETRASGPGGVFCDTGSQLIATV